MQLMGICSFEIESVEVRWCVALCRAARHRGSSGFQPLLCPSLYLAFVKSHSNSESLVKKRGSQHEMSPFCGLEFHTSINWRFYRFKDKAWRYLILSIMSTDLSCRPQPAVGSHISQHASCVWLRAPALCLLLRTQNVNLEKRNTYFCFHLEVEALLGCSVPPPALLENNILSVLLRDCVSAFFPHLQVMFKC